MNQNNDWESHQLLVMSALQDIKQTLKEQNKDQAEIRNEMDRIRQELAIYKTNAKWELRIMSAVWGLIIMGVNAMLGRHGS